MTPLQKTKLRRFAGYTLGFGIGMTALRYFDNESINWTAIVISAVFFGVVMTLFVKNKSPKKKN